MTAMTDTTAGVPDEAPLVIPDGVVPIATRAAGPVYREFHAGANLIGTDEERGGAIFLAGLLEVLEAGWVLVPGPVRTEWGVRYGSHPDAVAPRRDEQHARETAAQDGALEAAESRQVTDWRTTESTPNLPAHIEAALADPHSQYDGDGELLPHLLTFGPPESTQESAR
jgi:hypothetical protein